MQASIPQDSMYIDDQLQKYLDVCPCGDDCKFTTSYSPLVHHLLEKKYIPISCCLGHHANQNLTNDLEIPLQNHVPLLGIYVDAGLKSDRRMREASSPNVKEKSGQRPRY